MLDQLEAKGLTEDDLLKQMMGGQLSQENLDKGGEIDVSKMKMDDEMFKDFEKVMKE